MTVVFWICVALTIICLISTLGTIYQDGSYLEVLALLGLTVIFIGICIFILSLDAGILARFFITCRN